MTTEGLGEAAEMLGSMLAALPDMSVMHAPGTPAYRYWGNPSRRFYYYGFRVALSSQGIPK